MNKTVIIALSIIFLGGLAVYLVQTSHKTLVVEDAQGIRDSEESMAGDGDSKSMVGQKTEEEENDRSKTTNSVELGNTKTGNIVTVSHATLTEQGFVVIYQVKSTNETSVIGTSALLHPGTYYNLTIQINTVIAKDQVIVAVLHEDNGDGVFTSTAIDPYLGNQDEPVISSVDVVDVKKEDEDKKLNEKVNSYLRQNLTEERPEVN